MSSDEADEPLARDELIDRSIQVVELFRATCQSAGYSETSRVPIVSRHDPSVRFTNSTISVMKELLVATSVEERVFLIQPALRLRNLNHWLEHGAMSGFGCYFHAFGALAPPASLAEMHATVAAYLTEALDIEAGRVVIRASSSDDDLVPAAKATGLQVELDGYEQQRFRHVFGMDGVTGRNTNFAITTPVGPVDVANVIAIERERTIIAVEMAFGVNMVIAQMLQLTHPVLASIGALAHRHRFHTLISLDAIGAATALVMEGLRPVARGRGGNLRALLSVIAEDRSLSSDEIRLGASEVALGESTVRTHLSPLSADVPADLDPEATAWNTVEAIESLRQRKEA